jgi:hypothetical protein
MSLAIVTQPDPTKQHSPYRPAFIDCSSDTATIVRVVADVYDKTTLVTTIEKEPTLGTTDQFRLEYGEISKKYMGAEYHDSTSFLETHDCSVSASYTDLIIYEVTESGGVLSTTWAENGAGTGSPLNITDQYLFNGVDQHLQSIDNYYADGTSKKFLTNRPQNSKITRTQLYHCGILPQAESYDGGIFIEEFDDINGTGGSLNTGNSTIIAATYRKLGFTIDTTQLNALTKSVTYRIENGAAAQITEFFTVNVVEECNNTVNLFWQNHWGEFDQYHFKGNQTQKTKNKVKQITNRLNLDYDSTDRGVRDIRRTNTREYEIFTGLEKPEVIQWLAEIGESVDVSIIIDGVRVPINVKSVSSSIQNDEEGMYQLSVKYTLANERILQLG